MKLEGKVVLITGAGRGIGRATATVFANEGARLLVNDVGCDARGDGADASVIDEVVRELRSTGSDVVGDASNLVTHAAELVERTVATFGRLDAVVSCAGIRRDRGITKLDDEDAQRVMDVGFHAPRRLLRAATLHWTDARHGGAAILLGGADAFFGTARHGATAAAHGALIALARSAATELRRYEIRVNVVVPTARTRLTEDLPLFRGIQDDSLDPAHVSSLLAYLVSDDAREVHGEVLGAAGGRLYSLQSRETTGAFVEGRGFTPDEIHAHWNEITRG
ncbi:MAG: SDR family oxidoreductase [Myxococcota bacterium]